LIYLAPAAAQRRLQRANPVDALTVRWPNELVWLGSADGYDVEVAGRKVSVKLDGGKKMRGMQLWAFPDRSCLVAAPAQGGRESECVLWCGPSLTVIHDGVDG